MIIYISMYGVERLSLYERKLRRMSLYYIRDSGRPTAVQVGAQIMYILP